MHGVRSPPYLPEKEYTTLYRSAASAGSAAAIAGHAWSRLPQQLPFIVLNAIEPVGKGIAYDDLASVLTTAVGTGSVSALLRDVLAPYSDTRLAAITRALVSARAVTAGTVREVVLRTLSEREAHAEIIYTASHPDYRGARAAAPSSSSSSSSSHRDAGAGAGASSSSSSSSSSCECSALSRAVFCPLTFRR